MSAAKPKYWLLPATVLGNAAVSSLLAFWLVPTFARAAHIKDGQELGILPLLGVIAILFVLASTASQGFMSWRTSRGDRP